MVTIKHKINFKNLLNNSNINFNEYLLNKKGITENILLRISKLRYESKEITNFRKKAFKNWISMSLPLWVFFEAPKPNYFNQKFYSVPKNDIINKKNIQNIINELNLSTQKVISSKPIALDTIIGSVSVLSTLKLHLIKEGVIFCSLSEAVIKYPWLIQKYIGKVVSYKDNYYAALNSIIFSDGSFCYIPKDVKCSVDLSTYFRVEDEISGQFERTLIIVEDRGSVTYLEGCTAVNFEENQLHAAVVELIAFNESEIKYSTVQNWYTGNEYGVGGLYNLVTKRGLCLGNFSKISWTQIEVGSAITWKYPSCILLGHNSYGEFYSVTFTNNYQLADTGTKMIHLGVNTNSKIVSKSISSGYSQNCYRGSVVIGPRAEKSQNFTKCDSLLLGPNSLTSTFPYLIINNHTCSIHHEAAVYPINIDQLFYLQQRGLSDDFCVNIMINGFCEEVVNKMPLEFGLETNLLLSLKVENSLG
uniref:SufB protein n=1 Tax=Piridium sociabile TaxID=2570542 RepID=A0A5B9XVL2_9ALVE|nr:sufB protein [Piridium sociabile]